MGKRVQKVFTGAELDFAMNELWYRHQSKIMGESHAAMLRKAKKRIPAGRNDLREWYTKILNQGLWNAFQD